MSNIPINYLQFQHKLNFRQSGQQRLIHDPIRRKYLVQTPEETVRQLTVQYLMEAKGYPKNRISIEKMLTIHELTRRFDILVFEKEMQPLLLVECKAPAVRLSQATFRQIALYNLPINARYLLVTNGIDTYCCRMDYEAASFTFLEDVPAFPG
jgi:hypothetical protein